MDKVSIIMPAYNSSRYVKESIHSVLNQEYENWELIIVDDHSSDSTVDIISEIGKTDDRINIILLDKNGGAAVARNKGIEHATGRYISFLDSDDVWFPEKLSEQISFMENEAVSFSCTYYNKIDSNSKDMDRVISFYKSANYEDILRNCPGNSTVVYDSNTLGKNFVPQVNNREDYLMWLQLIRKAKQLVCVPKVLSSHRISPGGLSSNKKKLIKFHWQIYRDIEKLPFFKSVYLVSYWIGKGILGSKFVNKLDIK